MHWPTLGMTAWLVVGPCFTARASDFGAAEIASHPVLLPYSNWQPPQVDASPQLAPPSAPWKPSTQWQPSAPWQPPAESELEVDPATDPPPEEAAEPTSEVISEPLEIMEEPATEPVTESEPIEDESTIESSSPADATQLSVETEPTEKPENAEYFAALDAHWSQGFAAEPTAPVDTELTTEDALSFDEPATPEPALPPVTPYSPTTAVITRQLLPSIQHAYGLARHGAIYAARTEFIQVLRRIAQAKDAADGSDAHSQSLAAALRALDEADDFAPHGAQLEGEMNVTLIASAHRTPILEERTTPVRPIEAIALYHEYARHQFARAVAGEQAGSAALYGLGKMHNRLASSAQDDVGHERKSLVLFLAALDVAPGNHLASNEVGVLLARGGRPWEASILFRHAIDVAPSATVYHNLAVVDRQLGYHEQASANELYAQQLAARDRAAGAISKANGVRWVAPQEMSRAGQSLALEPAQHPAAQQPGLQQQRPAVGQIETATKWPQKLVPGFLRR